MVRGGHGHLGGLVPSHGGRFAQKRVLRAGLRQWVQCRERPRRKNSADGVAQFGERADARNWGLERETEHGAAESGNLRLASELPPRETQPVQEGPCGHDITVPQGKRKEVLRGRIGWKHLRDLRFRVPDGGYPPVPAPLSVQDMRGPPPTQDLPAVPIADRLVNLLLHVRSTLLEA